ncbi:MAG: hypothetical protein KKE05_02235 [Nanoarchaeota archaeon]|nr:hypothetical protein [Nanoarchaeota archaeon]
MADKDERIIDQCREAYVAALRGDKDIVQNHPIMRGFTGNLGSRVDVGEYIVQQVPEEARGKIYAEFIIVEEIKRSVRR